MIDMSKKPRWFKLGDRWLTTEEASKEVERPTGGFFMLGPFTDEQLVLVQRMQRMLKGRLQ